MTTIKMHYLQVDRQDHFYGKNYFSCDIKVATITKRRYLGDQQYITYTEFFLRISCFHSRVDQRPEAGVVEIVDVAVSLTPAKVVPEILIGRIEDNAAVKGGRVLEGRVREECRPMKYVG